jgi:hypothetical protein
MYKLYVKLLHHEDQWTFQSDEVNVVIEMDAVVDLITVCLVERFCPSACSGWVYRFVILEEISPDCHVSILAKANFAP